MRRQVHSSCSYLRDLQLMKINLRIRWSNLPLLGSGAQGEKCTTNGQFSIWPSWVKRICKKKKKIHID